VLGRGGEGLLAKEEDIFFEVAELYWSAQLSRTIYRSTAIDDTARTPRATNTTRKAVFMICLA
jgi:hypothetical protein